MPKEAPAVGSAAGSVDPLSEFSGLSLFPRTIRASADAPVPAAPKDLDSIHNIMKSLEWRSPEKLMSEAKRIVDGGANILSNFSSFAENVSVTNNFGAKDKDKPHERRPGLGIARKKASFSLKSRISHPSVNLEPTLDIDHLEDPDLFFDLYERNENAKKEIQKQLGGNMENIGLYKPSNNERCRRPGILGKSYNYKHRYSSTASENDDMWMLSQEMSQETTVYQDNPSPLKDDSQEKMTIPDPNVTSDVEEVELNESMEKSQSQVNDMLEEILSGNYEDLDGQGALNLLQERLKIKTLDMDNLCLSELPDVGRTNIITSSGSRNKRRKSSVVLDSVLKNLNKEPHMEQELVENPADLVSSPTPPRNPFGSVSLLKKKFFQPNPLRDPFSPEDIDLCAHPNSSFTQLKEKITGQAASPKNFSMCKPAFSYMETQVVMGKADKMPEQSSSENACMQGESGSSRANASAQLKDKVVGQVATPKDLGTSNELESHVEFGCTEPSLSDMDSLEVMGKDKLTGQVASPKNLGMCNELESHVEFGYTEPALSYMETQEVMGKADKMPEQSSSDNVCMQRESGSSRANASAQPKDKVVGQVASPKDLGTCNELESQVEFGCTEPSLFNKDSQEVMGKADKISGQSRSENATMQRESGSSRANDSPAQPNDKLVEQVDAQKNLGILSGVESYVEFDSTAPPMCNLNSQEAIGNADGLLEQFENENASIPGMDASRRENEESDNFGNATDTNGNESNPSVVDKEARDDTSTRRLINPELEVHAAKRKRGKGAAGISIRDKHPMRPSLAEAGTSFETGVRRSKRVKMRPLEYWKGERFLYGRVNDSLKLIGIKYFSPGKGNENLKVKPYNLSEFEKPEYKEVLELAARH